MWIKSINDNSCCKIAWYSKWLSDFDIYEIER